MFPATCVATFCDISQSTNRASPLCFLSPRASERGKLQETCLYTPKGQVESFLSSRAELGLLAYHGLYKLKNNNNKSRVLPAWTLVPGRFSVVKLINWVRSDIYESF